MFDKAQLLEKAARSSYSSTVPLYSPINAAIPLTDLPSDSATSLSTPATASGIQGQKCYFCGNSKHPRSRCPARDATCSKFQKKQKVCRGGAPPLTTRGTSAAMWHPTVITVSAAVPLSFAKSTTSVSIMDLKPKHLLTLAVWKVSLTLSWSSQLLFMSILHLVQFQWQSPRWPQK